MLTKTVTFVCSEILSWGHALALVLVLSVVVGAEEGPALLHPTSYEMMVILFLLLLFMMVMVMMVVTYLFF